MNKQYINDFFTTQKIFFVRVMKDYFAPLKSMYVFVKLLFGVVIEVPRQMFICLIMDNDEYKKLQDYKFKEESEEMSKSGASIEEIEVKLDK